MRSDLKISKKAGLHESTQISNKLTDMTYTEIENSKPTITRFKELNDPDDKVNLKRNEYQIKSSIYKLNKLSGLDTYI